ncbi:RNA-directed DNA polymerase, eukaryota [Tanacetum coccineum]
MHMSCIYFQKAVEDDGDEIIRWSDGLAFEYVLISEISLQSKMAGSLSCNVIKLRSQILIGRPYSEFSHFHFRHLIFLIRLIPDDTYGGIVVFMVVVDVLIPSKKSMAGRDSHSFVLLRYFILDSPGEESVYSLDWSLPLVLPIQVYAWVNGVSSSVHPGSLISPSPALVLDDALFVDEGFEDVNLFYLGGKWVMFEFNNGLNTKEKAYSSDDESARGENSKEEQSHVSEEEEGEFNTSDVEGVAETIFGDNSASSKNTLMVNEIPNMDKEFHVISAKVMNFSQAVQEEVSCNSAGQSEAKNGGSVLGVLEEVIRVGQAMGGLGNKTKKEWVKELTNKNKINFIAIQETKMERVSHMDVKFMWGNSNYDYVCSDSLGNSGGASIGVGFLIRRFLRRLNLKCQLNDIKAMEATDSLQKSKVRWAIEGDENSKYFHGIINKKRSHLAIRGVFDEGIWLTDPSLVKKAFIDHYGTRFKKPTMARLKLKFSFPNRLSQEQAADLERGVSRDEIRSAVWDCGEISSWSVGFTFEFFRRYWEFIGPDFCDAVEHFFVNGSFSKGCNSSFIALIPKVPDAKFVNDYRPISLIGSVYKVVTKIMANRLALVIADIVSETQSAFVAERQILDGPFILNEVLHWCKKKNKKAMFFKVDFAKAYDSVRWDFLIDVLEAFGFGPIWCNWIRDHLASLVAYYDYRKFCRNGIVMVLGDLGCDRVQSAFIAGRQILDGPFILSEVLQWCKSKKKQSLIFKVDFEKVFDSVRWDFLDDILRKFGFGNKWCKWIRKCLMSSRGSILINGSPTEEFQFFKVVDDGYVYGVQFLVSRFTLSHMCQVIRFNHEAKRIMGVHVDSDKVQHAAGKLGCLILNTPFSYLGTKVGGIMSRVESWKEVIDKVESRLSKWKMHALSIVIMPEDGIISAILYIAIHGEDGNVDLVRNPVSFYKSSSLVDLVNYEGYKSFTQNGAHGIYLLSQEHRNREGGMFQKVCVTLCGGTFGTKDLSVIKLLFDETSASKAIDILRTMCFLLLL